MPEANGYGLRNCKQTGTLYTRVGQDMTKGGFYVDGYTCVTRFDLVYDSITYVSRFIRLFAYDGTYGRATFVSKNGYVIVI